jgi:hypothetical protein
MLLLSELHHGQVVYYIGVPFVFKVRVLETSLDTDGMLRVKRLSDGIVARVRPVNLEYTVKGAWK